MSHNKANTSRASVDNPQKNEQAPSPTAAFTEKG